MDTYFIFVAIIAVLGLGMAIVNAQFYMDFKDENNRRLARLGLGITICSIVWPVVIVGGLYYLIYRTVRVALYKE